MDDQGQWAVGVGEGVTKPAEYEDEGTREGMLLFIFLRPGHYFTSHECHEVPYPVSHHQPAPRKPLPHAWGGTVYFQESNWPEDRGRLMLSGQSGRHGVPCPRPERRQHERWQDNGRPGR
eukprot:scaffold45000_cov39-Phaeocystis_antarctica.AAC.1